MTLPNTRNFIGNWWKLKKEFPAMILLMYRDLRCDPYFKLAVCIIKSAKTTTDKFSWKPNHHFTIRQIFQPFLSRLHVCILAHSNSNKAQFKVAQISLHKCKTLSFVLIHEKCRWWCDWLRKWEKPRKNPTFSFGAFEQRNEVKQQTDDVEWRQKELEMLKLSRLQQRNVGEMRKSIVLKAYEWMNERCLYKVYLPHCLEWCSLYLFMHSFVLIRKECRVFRHIYYIIHWLSFTVVHFGYAFVCFYTFLFQKSPKKSIFGIIEKNS